MESKFSLATLALLVSLCLWTGNPVSAPGIAAAQTGFQVIVNESNPLDTLPKDTLSRYFLKRESRWPHGGNVVPVDQPTASPLRGLFSTTVHKRSAAAISAYWQRAIFTGRGVPPPTRSGDTAIVEFVATNPNAIGYVSQAIPLRGNIKALKIVE